MGARSENNHSRVVFDLVFCYGTNMIAQQGSTDDLHIALDRLCADDLSALTDHELQVRVMEVLRAKIRLEYVHMTSLQAWDDRKIWCDDGSRSPGARAAAETGVDKTHVAAALRRARRLSTLPATAAAVRAGALSPEVIDVLFDASKLTLDLPFAEAEPTLVDACVAVGSREARSVLARWIAEHDQAGQDERERRNLEKRNLSVADTLDAMVHINGLLPAVAGREFRNELDRLERNMFLVDKHHGVTRTGAQRRADALAQMARRSATLDIDEHHPQRSPRILLSVVVGRGTVERLCETLDGVPLPTGELIPELERIDIERLVFDGPDTIIGVSTQRTFTGALRRAIVVRDGRCTHPSICDTPADNCDVDHTIPWSQGGITSQTNGGVQCRPHNRHPDLHNTAPPPDAHRIWRPPRGWIPTTPTGPTTDHDQPDDADRDTDRNVDRE